MKNVPYSELRKQGGSIVSVYILEDKPLFIDGLKCWFKTLYDFRIVYTGSDWHEVKERINNMEPCILISSSAYIKDIFSELQDFSFMKVICLCENTVGIKPESVFSSNIYGIMNLTIEKNEFIHGLKSIAEGRIYISTRAMQTAAENILFRNQVEPVINLTRREQEVVSFISMGFSDKEIGEMMHLSKRTIDGYRNNLLVKFNARNSAHLVRAAMDCKMILPEEVLQNSFLH